ncbi:MAG: 2-phospho-L-lactate transferase [Pseudorhodoplanes sp.]
MTALMQRKNVVALSGGIGGAKLALGLSQVVEPRHLVVVVNTGDDFEHLGLSISPDLDTLLYTLAGIANPETGWGRHDESWRFMAALGELGGETWFKLGDTDLATNVERTRRLKRGDTLSAITADFCVRLGVGARILPMSDDLVRTRVRTATGWLDFQDYFVRLRCEPKVEGFAFDGADRAQAQPEFLALLRDPALRAVVICPSNPFISIDPILALPGVVDALAECSAPVVAVSPIVGGRAVKGPTAKMMRELGHDVSAEAVAARYRAFLDGCVIDASDRAAPSLERIRVLSANTLMHTLEDSTRLAREVLAFADALSATSSQKVG